MSCCQIFHCAHERPPSEGRGSERSSASVLVAVLPTDSRTRGFSSRRCIAMTDTTSDVEGLRNSIETGLDLKGDGAQPAGDAAVASTPPAPQANATGGGGAWKPRWRSNPDAVPTTYSEPKCVDTKACQLALACVFTRRSNALRIDAYNLFAGKGQGCFKASTGRATSESSMAGRATTALSLWVAISPAGWHLPVPLLPTHKGRLRRMRLSS